MVLPIGFSLARVSGSSAFGTGSMYEYSSYINRRNLAAAVSPESGKIATLNAFDANNSYAVIHSDDGTRDYCKNHDIDDHGGLGYVQSLENPAGTDRRFFFSTRGRFTTTEAIKTFSYSETNDEWNAAGFYRTNSPYYSDSQNIFSQHGIVPSSIDTTRFGQVTFLRYDGSGGLSGLGRFSVARGHTAGSFGSRKLNNSSSAYESFAFGLMGSNQDWIATGYYSGNSWVQAFDTSYNLQWCKLIGNGNTTITNGVAVGTDEWILSFTTADTQVSGSNASRDLLLQRRNSSGTRSWSKAYMLDDNTDASYSHRLHTDGTYTWALCTVNSSANGKGHVAFKIQNSNGNLIKAWFVGSGTIADSNYIPYAGSAMGYTNGSSNAAVGLTFSYNDGSGYNQVFAWFEENSGGANDASSRFYIKEVTDDCTVRSSANPSESNLSLSWGTQTTNAATNTDSFSDVSKTAITAVS